MSKPLSALTGFNSNDNNETRLLHFRCFPLQLNFSLMSWLNLMLFVRISLLQWLPPPQIQWHQHQVAVRILWRQKTRAFVMFNQSRWGQECSPLVRGTKSHPTPQEGSLLPPFEVWNLRAQQHLETQDPSPTSQTSLTLEGHPKFTFSETRAWPKETESMQLKLLCVHKRRVASAPLSPSLHTSVCQRDKRHEETLIFISGNNKIVFFYHHVNNLIRWGSRITLIKAFTRSVFLNVLMNALFSGMDYVHCYRAVW